MTEEEMLARMVPPSQRRRRWRNGILQIHITRACNESCFHCTQASNLSGRPAMMTPDQFEKACDSLRGYFGVVGIFGGNPCLAGGTLVYTDAGIFPIEELEGRAFRVRNLNGELKDGVCWHSGKQQLYEVRLRGGHSYFATANHEWPAMELRYDGNSKNKNASGYCPRKKPVSLGKIKTMDLRPGMRLPLLTSDDLGYGSDGDAEDGFLSGWILGDGWVSKKMPPRQRARVNGLPDKRFAADGRVRSVGMIVNQQDRSSGVADRLSAAMQRLGSDASWRAVKKCHEIFVASRSMDDWLDRFGLIGKSSGLPSSVWTTASESYRRGLIDGLFSSDGHVEVSRGRGYARVRLTSAHRQLVDDVSRLLGFYGIKTQVSTRTRTGSFPNGKDYGRQYESYELSVSNALSVERFAKLFPLTHAEKNARLQGAVGRHKTSDVDSTNIEIVSVTPTERVEDVWDISVGDETHCFQLAHCVTGNCIHPKFPEICEIFRSKFELDQRGLWSNNPMGHGKVCAETFAPWHSNLNVHLDQAAYNEFARDWPECRRYLKGHDSDSSHGSPYVSRSDIGLSEDEIAEGTATCEVNQEWSALIGVARGDLRAYVCELMYMFSVMHEGDPDWPETGLAVEPGWWCRPMQDFADQVRVACRHCGMPNKTDGQLAIGGQAEQVSKTHLPWFRPKQKDRQIQRITNREQIRIGAVNSAIEYIENGSLPRLPIVGQ